MDDARTLAEIEARWAGVGPWHAQKHDGADNNHVVFDDGGMVVADYVPLDKWGQLDGSIGIARATAETIAAAPEDVAWMIARVKELEWAAECAAVARMDGDA